jgi:hypothetical protein
MTMPQADVGHTARRKQSPAWTDRHIEAYEFSSFAV